MSDAPHTSPEAQAALDRLVHRLTFMQRLFIVLAAAWLALAGLYVLDEIDDRSQERSDGLAACRSELAADDARAQGQVILVITMSLLVPPAERAGNAELLERLQASADELTRTQERRQRANEICDPDN